MNRSTLNRDLAGAFVLASAVILGGCEKKTTLNPSSGGIGVDATVTRIHASDTGTVSAIELKFPAPGAYKVVVSPDKKAPVILDFTIEKAGQKIPLSDETLQSIGDSKGQIFLSTVRDSEKKGE